MKFKISNTSCSKSFTPSIKTVRISYSKFLSEIIFKFFKIVLFSVPVIFLCILGFMAFKSKIKPSVIEDNFLKTCCLFCPLVSINSDSFLSKGVFLISVNKLYIKADHRVASPPERVIPLMKSFSAMIN